MSVVKEEKGPVWKTVMYLIAGIAAAGMYWGLSYAPAHFIEIFTNLNTALPVLTQLLLQSRIPYLVLSAISAALLLAYLFTLFDQDDYPFVRKMVKLNFVLACVLALVTLVMMYMPILSQGEVI